MTISARVTSTYSRPLTVMGEVEERTWTVVQAEEDGGPSPGEVGRREVTRRVHFAFRAEGEDWAAEQRAGGFGPATFAHAATPYFGLTDSTGNCWSVEVRKPLDAPQTAGELAHPNWAYRDANGGLLMGPCDTLGCPYASKPGGARHDGACDPR